MVARQIPCVVSVTTEAAQGLYPTDGALSVWVGRLTPATFDRFLQQWRVRGVLDASHPFATEISAGAMAAAQRQGLAYRRFERPALPPAPGVERFSDLDTLLAALFAAPVRQRVLLVLGYRQLAAFQPWQHRADLYARILPSVTALQAALAAGFAAQRLVALRPPISREVEAALWRQWHITTVVAKASGVAGGEAIKQQLAQAMQVRLLLLDRPQLAYPAVIYQVEEAVAFGLCAIAGEFPMSS